MWKLRPTVKPSTNIANKYNLCLWLSTQNEHVAILKHKIETEISTLFKKDCLEKGSNGRILRIAADSIQLKRKRQRVKTLWIIRYGAGVIISHASFVENMRMSLWLAFFTVNVYWISHRESQIQLPESEMASMINRDEGFSPKQNTQELEDLTRHHGHRETALTVADAITLCGCFSSEYEEIKINLKKIGSLCHWFHRF